MRFASADARSLGLWRIVLGVLLVLDLVDRYREAGALYSNEGVLTNHFALFRPLAPHQFSLFFALSQARDVKVALLLTLAVYLLFFVGYRTRLFQILSLVLVTSLHARNLLAEVPGDAPLHLLLAWSLLLPLGARFSVDAVRRSLAREPQHNAGDLAERSPATETVTSLAVAGTLLQIAALHLGPALWARGEAWRDGTALYNALHQRMWTTALGAWAGDHVTSGVLTSAYRSMNLLVGVLVLVPVVAARRLALVLLVALHVGGRALFDMGLYEWVLVGTGALLLTDRDWAWLRNAYARRKARLVVYFDADCGVCFATVRLLARLDALSRITFAASRDPDAPDAVRALADHTVVTRVLPGGELLVQGRAFARIFRSLPLLAPVGWFLVLPGVSWLADRAYEAFAARRTGISAWLGYGACGTGGSARRRPVHSIISSDIAPVARECTAVLFLAVGVACFAFDVHDDGEDSGFRGTLSAVVGYPRAFQVTEPALPDTSAEEGMLVIDAVTAHGPSVDPLRPFSGKPLWNAYFSRISQPRSSPYLDGLREFLRNQADSGPAQDKLLSFTISWLVHPIRPPGAELRADAADAFGVRRKLIGHP
jgi:predicted DCC family thiol-disulfide oxidoreductase YuxK